MNIVNATPHTVNLLKEDGSVSRDFEPEVLIRVASDTTPVGENGRPVDTPKLLMVLSRMFQASNKKIRRFL